MKIIFKIIRENARIHDFNFIILIFFSYYKMTAETVLMSAELNYHDDVAFKSNLHLSADRQNPLKDWLEANNESAQRFSVGECSGR